MNVLEDSRYSSTLFSATHIDKDAALSSWLRSYSAFFVAATCRVNEQIEYFCHCLSNKTKIHINGKVRMNLYITIAKTHATYPP